ncbi:unnamed protein product [Lasius platythorax]|uniref:Uncharacterized protein n=1 Tax=Lasius platythorax TaxID=488582 RepID=A0AAV2N3X9_9HYME
MPMASDLPLNIASLKALGDMSAKKKQVSSKHFTSKASGSQFRSPDSISEPTEDDKTKAAFSSSRSKLQRSFPDEELTSPRRLNSPHVETVSRFREQTVR